MTNFKKMVVIALALSLLGFSTKGVAESPTYEDNLVVSNESILTASEYISMYSEIFNTDAVELTKIAQCESHLGKYKTGDKGLATGLFMYHSGTWTRAVNLYRSETKDYTTVFDKTSIKDQAFITSYIWANHPEWKKQWSTYVAYKNGGTYSFYSRVLQGYYTVTCK